MSSAARATWFASWPRADGLQLTGDELSTWRHFSNALFNVMRGGIPDRGLL